MTKRMTDDERMEARDKARCKADDKAYARLCRKDPDALVAPRVPTILDNGQLSAAELSFAVDGGTRVHTAHATLVSTYDTEAKDHVYTMTGASGKHTLYRCGTDSARLRAHWDGFKDNAAKAYAKANTVTLKFSVRNGPG